MTIHIIIPVHNRKELTRNCLSSLLQQSYQNFTVYLVDDGSSDGTSSMVETEFMQRMDIKILSGNGQLWWAGAIKAGVDLAIINGQDDDLILTLNNDVVLFSDFLNVAVKLCEKYPSSFLGGISVDTQNRQKITATGWKMISWPFAWTKRIWWPANFEDLHDEPEVESVDFIPGTATLIPIRLVKKHGTVNPDILPHYHADSEYAYRLKMSGVPVLISRKLPIYHNVSSTGLLSNVRERPKFTDILRSFGSIKSGNNLKYKWNFAKACCPRWALISFMFFDTLKVLIRSFGILLFGESIDKAKKWTNRS